MAPILIDLTHTSHTRARTGVQRVARALVQTLGAGARPICHDPYLRAWRPLERWEAANIAALAPGARRGARWPLAARVRGTLRRLLSARLNRLVPVGGGAFLAPEIFSPVVATALPGLFSSIPGPRGAIFHDAIALTHPELTPPGSVARAPGYLQDLAGFDGVAAVSQDSRDRLIEHWRRLGLHDLPPVAAIPLGIDPPPPPPAMPAPALPVVLSVGTIEGRKNHLALLEACELLWARGMRFELRLIGLAQTQTGAGALRRIWELQRAGRPLVYLGAVGDAAREDAYAACEFTVYPSLAEGFGLPIAESVARGRPCICLGRGALGEISRGGGCLTVDSADAGAFASAIGLLLSDPGKRAALAAAAKMRPVRTWSDYSRDVAAWIGDLPRRTSRSPTMGQSS
ncbi:MAG: glycosyltransferase [Opitutaceae bacterium]|jgi:glycosyltransferase involved in cell wall biosynthesis